MQRCMWQRQWLERCRVRIKHFALEQAQTLCIMGRWGGVLVAFYVISL
jgi:hypothetical protein